MDKAGKAAKVDPDGRWARELAELGSKPRTALSLMAGVFDALDDARTPSQPKAWDMAWRWIADWGFAWFLLPLVAAGCLDDWLSHGWNPSWAAAGRLGALCASFWVALACLWRASRSSWKGRWAGPVECADAVQKAGRFDLLKEWLDQAKGRGLRCVDLDVMCAIEDLWVDKRSRERRVQQREEELARRRDAYAEINQDRLAAMQEKILLGAGLEQEPVQSKPRARL